MVNAQTLWEVSVWEIERPEKVSVEVVVRAKRVSCHQVGGRLEGQ